MNSAQENELYRLLPAVHQIRDQRSGESLRALLEIVDEQVDHLRHDIDRMYGNWFIETCDDWVVPYIADLVGFNKLDDSGQPGDALTAANPELNRFLFPRREVGTTIRTRRRKGTLSVLEDLAFYVSGWYSRAVELGHQVFATPNPEFSSNELSCTVDFANMEERSGIYTPFSRTAHCVDLASTRSTPGHGWYHPAKVGLFVWRRRVHSITHGQLGCTGNKDSTVRYLTFSPLGMDTPLLVRPEKELEPVDIAREVHLPIPLTRLRLSDPETCQPLPEYYGPAKSLAIYISGRILAPTRIVVCDLSLLDCNPLACLLALRNLTNNHSRPIGIGEASLNRQFDACLRDRVAVDPECGRLVVPCRLLAEFERQLRVDWHYSAPADFAGGEYHRSRPSISVPFVRCVDLPDQSGLVSDALQMPLPSLDCHSSGELDSIIVNDELVVTRDLGIELTTSTSWSLSNLKKIVVGDNTTLVVRSAPRRRPILEVPPTDSDCKHGFLIEMGAGSRLVLDGLLIRGNSLQFHDLAKPEHEAPPKNASNPGDCSNEADSKLSSAGSLNNSIEIRHCTFVPETNAESECDDCTSPAHSLFLKLRVAKVEIADSILGAIKIDDPYCGSGDTKRPRPIQRATEFCVRDSIIDGGRQGTALSGNCCSIAHAHSSIQRCTILGRFNTEHLVAEDSIFMGEVQVARRQSGYMRFCFVPPELNAKKGEVVNGLGSLTPRRFKCQPDTARAQCTSRRLTSESGIANCDSIASGPSGPPEGSPGFISTRYGEAGYCQLATNAPREILEGAESESEMGAFHNLFHPQRIARLRLRLSEFTPASMSSALIFADEFDLLPGQS